VTFLRGKLLSGALQYSVALLRDIGALVGEVDQLLCRFDHPAAASRDLDWDLNSFVRARQFLNELGLVQGPKRKHIAEHFIQLYDTEVQPHLGALRRSIIHSDFNDNNVCISDDETRVSGFFDFGDMVQTSTVNDIAIACAYVILGPIPGHDASVNQTAGCNDVLNAVELLATSFHTKYPLSKLELQLLFPLLCTRLTQSVLMSAHSRALEPDNEYLGITEGPAWRMLERLVQQPIAPVAARLHAACGYPSSTISPSDASSQLASRTCAALRTHIVVLQCKNEHLKSSLAALAAIRSGGK
jgi:Ser/Thr protein kinase RdoA (MazF antagonist)